MENHSSMTGWKELFSDTNLPNFRRPLQLLLFRYTVENLQITQFLQLVLTKFFKSDMSKSNINVSFIDKWIASVALEPKGASHKWQQKKLDTNNTVNNCYCYHVQFAAHEFMPEILCIARFCWVKTVFNCVIQTYCKYEPTDIAPAVVSAEKKYCQCEKEKKEADKFLILHSC